MSDSEPGRPGSGLRPFRWGDVSGSAVGLVGAVVVARAALYVHLGAHHVLDDYDLLYGAQRFGVGDFILGYWRGRPLAGLVDALLYAGIGPRPLLLLVGVTLLNLVAAWLLLVLLRRFVALGTACAVVVVWLLAANHTSLTVWTATAPTVVALILLLAGTLLLTTARWPWAALPLAMAALSYELVLPACLVAVAVVPSSRPLSWRQRIAVGVPTLSAGVWVLLNPVYEDAPIPSPDVSLFWRALFSDGLLGTANGPERVVHWLGDLALIGLVACVVAWLLGRREREAGPWLALVGVGVMAAGSAGFLRIGLGLQSVGVFDRLLAVSSIGAAMVLVGIAQLIWHTSRPAAVALLPALVVAMAIGQYVALRSWSTAGADIEAALAFVDATRPTDGQVVDVAVGPYSRSHNGVPSTSTDYDILMIANELRSDPRIGEVRTVDGGPSAFVAQSAGERLIDWRWIDNAWFFDEGVGFLAEVDVSGPGQATVSAWAEDGPPGAAPVEVAILVDGGVVRTAVADRARADLAAAVGRPNPSHALEETIDVPPGRRTICVRTVGHGEVGLGCEDVEVSSRTADPS